MTSGIRMNPMCDNDRSMIFQFLCVLTFVVGVALLARHAGTPPPDKIYIYDVDFYENLTITEKEID